MHGQTDLCCNSRTVFGVNLVEVSDESFLDVFAASTKRARDVVDQVSAVFLGQDLPEEGARLLVVVVGVLVGVPADGALDWMSVDGVVLVLNWAFNGSWLVVGSASAVSIDAHTPVTDVVGAKTRSVWAVDWNLIVVNSQTISVGVRVVQKSSLEHLVHRGLNTWNHMGWGKSTLFGFSVEVLWVSVKHNLSNWLQRVV